MIATLASTPHAALGQHLKQARCAQGLSLQGMAAALASSSALIKALEAGRIGLNSSQAHAWANACGCWVDDLMPVNSVNIETTHWLFSDLNAQGSRLSFEPPLLPAKDRIMSEVTIQLARYALLFKAWPTQALRRFSLPKCEPLKKPVSAWQGSSLEASANTLRESWALGQGAVASLTNVLETQGVIVLSLADSSKKSQGMAGRVAFSDAETCPFIALPSHWSASTKRIVLAKVLADWVLEKASDVSWPDHSAGVAGSLRWARAFLMPNAAMHSLLGAHRSVIAAEELRSVARCFGVRPEDVIERAKELGILAKNWVDAGLTYCGFERMDSFGVDSLGVDSLSVKERSGLGGAGKTDLWLGEQPEQLGRWVAHAVTEGWISESQASALLGLRQVDWVRNWRSKHAP